MRLLNDDEMALVSGGDYAEEAQAAAAAAMSAIANAFTLAATTLASYTLAPVIKLNEVVNQVVNNPNTQQACFTTQFGNTTSQTCYNTDGTTTTMVCVQCGPSGSVGGTGFGVVAQACNTTIVTNNP